MANFLENLWGTEGAVDILFGGPQYRQTQQAIKNALENKEELKRAIEEVKKYPIGSAERAAAIQECQLHLGLRPQLYQQAGQADWAESARDIEARIRGLPRDPDTDEVLEEWKPKQQWLLEQLDKVYKEEGGYSPTSRRAPATPEKEGIKPGEPLDRSQWRQYYPGGVVFPPREQGAAMPTDVFRGLTPSVQPTPSPLATSPVQPPGQTIFGYPGMVGPAPVKSPAKLDGLFAGVPSEESPMDEIDVFEKLIPKKTVSQLQKQVSRDPTVMELGPILAQAKVPRSEIYKEAAELKSIWSELTLEEKFDAYKALAQGIKAKEIIQYFKKQTKENAQ